MSEPLLIQEVNRVERAHQALTETTPKTAVELLVNGQVEACSEYHGSVVASPYHPLVAAVHHSFAQHRPLVLSPDMFWLLIAQGLAQHVNANADELRPKFVGHQGKDGIEVRRDDFVKNSPENPWSEVFPEFSNAIKALLGERNHSNIVATFSTTGALEKAALEVVLMDVVQSYFEYEVKTICGIPEVILEGQLSDWQELGHRADRIGRDYDLKWWTNRIVPILARIAENTAGRDDPEIWRDIYRLRDGSGGPFITGWLSDFFPYIEHLGLRKFVRNPFEEDDFWGPTVENLPSGLCKVPFRWNYSLQHFDMEFIAGFTSFTQDSNSLALRPKIGWAVRERG